MKQHNEENFMPDLFFPDKDEKLIKHYKQTIAVNIHHFYIIDEIGESDEYLDLINVLKTAEQQDTIFVYLNTPGGNLFTAIQIMSAIRNTAATVVTCLEGEVCSAGTMLFLCGHKQIVNPNCSFMIHNYSAGIGGKGHEIASHVAFRNEYSRKLMNDIYVNFLTTKEIEEVLDGKDIWLSSDQVIERLEKKDSLMSSDINTTNIAEKIPEYLGELFKTEAAATKKTSKASIKDKKNKKIIKKVLPKKK